jgi:hypothetical protein
VADNEQHRAALQELNRNYIRSVDEADVAWFDANLAADFSTPTLSMDRLKKQFCGLPRTITLT